MRGICNKILGYRYERLKVKLERERATLNHIVIQLNQKGESLVENKELLEQNYKVDEILIKVIRLQNKIVGLKKRDKRPKST